MQGTAAQGYGAGGGSGCVGAPPQQNGGGGHKNPVQAAILEAMNSPALCNNDATLDTVRCSGTSVAACLCDSHH